MKYIKLPVPLLNQLVNYMATKPFKEVAGLIKTIEAEAKPLEENEENKKAKQA